MLARLDPLAGARRARALRRSRRAGRAAEAHARCRAARARAAEGSVARALGASLGTDPAPVAFGQHAGPRRNHTASPAPNRSAHWRACSSHASCDDAQRVRALVALSGQLGVRRRQEVLGGRYIAFLRSGRALQWMWMGVARRRRMRVTACSRGLVIGCCASRRSWCTARCRSGRAIRAVLEAAPELAARSNGRRSPSRPSMIPKRQFVSE